MGSGCTQQSSKRDSCFTKLSDECVMYTGAPMTIGGTQICTGDRMAEVTAVILQNLLDLTEGEGITIPDIVVNCPYVTGILANQGIDLTSRLQVLYDAACDFNARLVALETAVEPPYPFDLGCLPTPTVVSRDTILQETITKTCENSASITNILNQLADDTSEESILNAVVELIGNKLLSQITSCQNNIVKTGSGATAALQFTGQIPIGGQFFSTKIPVSAFDSSGKGLASAGMCGWAIANGQNGTEDMRGFTAAGSNSSFIPGGSLNAMVQPGLDTDLQMNIGSAKGAYKVTLLPSQIPNHTHTVTQQPHSHTVNGIVGQNSPDFGNGGAGYDLFQGSVTTSSTTIDLQVGGVTGGSGVAHENRPPTKYGMWIERIS